METSIKPWNVGKTPRQTNNELLLNMNENHGEPWEIQGELDKNHGEIG